MVPDGQILLTALWLCWRLLRPGCVGSEDPPATGGETNEQRNTIVAGPCAQCGIPAVLISLGIESQPSVLVSRLFHRYQQAMLR